MLPDDGLKIWSLVWFIVKSECAWASMTRGMSDARSHLWHDHVVLSGMVHYGISTVKAGKRRLKKLLGLNHEAQTEWLYVWIICKTIIFTTDLRSFYTNRFTNDWCVERDHLQNVFYKHFRHYMWAFTQACFYKQFFHYLQQFT